MWLRLSRAVELTILLAFAASLAPSAAILPGDEQDQARRYTRNIEFEYLSWMQDAARLKAAAGAAGIPGYVDRASRRIIVSDYLQVTQKVILAQDALNKIYADPQVEDKIQAAAYIKQQLLRLGAVQDELAPLAEAVLQSQVTEVAAALGLTTLGQPIPEVLYHSTSVPDALIVSPRDLIRQTANISIQPGLPADQQTQLEQRVEQGLDASALVVPIGGIGVYPTMITQTTDRRWLVDTIAHEWTHNYLELRPLGLLYDRTPELRTMNETTADIVGTEIGDQVEQRYYASERRGLAANSPMIGLLAHYPDPHDADPPPFDFRSEMHTTRTTVDNLLASGKILEAETYMEQRRKLFLENGFYIRRLNQAYFAFYGAYADVPGGPAGADPVGPAVRALRAESGSLAEFLKRISWMTSFHQLQVAVRN
ncbi:MAG TPA: hypothetical protein VIU38_13080 [Anaerolineales bacterium]